MSAKHSPAPWRNGGPASDNDCNLHIYDADGVWVGTARPWSLHRANKERQQANADVIVEAPVLLAVLMDLDLLLDFASPMVREGECAVRIVEPDRFNEVAERARAAIARAAGGAQ